MTFQFGGEEQKVFLDFGFRGGLKVGRLEGKEIRGDRGTLEENWKKRWMEQRGSKETRI